MSASHDNAIPTGPEEPLPPRPEQGDCCNGGCAVCVLEGYDEEVAQWEREVEAIKARNELRRRAAQNQPST